MLSFEIYTEIIPSEGLSNGWHGGGNGVFETYTKTYWTGLQACELIMGHKYNTFTRALWVLSTKMRTRTYKPYHKGSNNPIGIKCIQLSSTIVFSILQSF